jgi:hypothetical protein
LIIWRTFDATSSISFGPPPDLPFAFALAIALLLENFEACFFYTAPRRREASLAEKRLLGADPRVPSATA